MRNALRSQLSASHLLVSLLGMLLAGLLIWFAVEGVFLANQRENLLAQARLTAAGLEGTSLPIPTGDIYSQTTNVSPGLHTRLVSESGAVILGIPFPAGQDLVQIPPAEDPGYVSAEQLMERPEILSALAGEAATAVRRVDSGGGRRVLYAAAPVLDGSGKVTYLVYLAMPLPPRGLPASITLKLIGAGLGGLLLAWILGRILARRLAQPLEALDQAAAAISEGDLTQRVDISSDISEVKNLGRTFNQMGASLQHSRQTQDAFLADVTHELRTPLTVIKGSIETLEDGGVDDPQGRVQLLELLNKESERLIRLVNDLLTITRADASALNLDLQPLEMVKLSSERWQALEPLWSAKRLLLRTQIDQPDSSSPVVIAGDPDRTSQILDNILTNAIRHAPAESEILLTLKFADDNWECRIEDQGPGIPPEHLPFLFERFYRVDTARDRGSGGSGLGLSIARALAEAQGGRVKAENRSGGGARFTIWLPALPAEKLP